MLFTRVFQETPDIIYEKQRIRELIEFERYCRDHQHWEDMHKCFSPDSHVAVSWYQGSGRGFVEASMQSVIVAPHRLNNIIVWINGNKAVAECMASIQNRKEIDRIGYDLTSYVRLLYRLVKENNDWYVFSMDAIYEKDTLIPAFPTEQIIYFDTDKQTSRSSYKNLTYVLLSEGCEIDENLPGDDRPESVEALYERCDAWLRV